MQQNRLTARTKKMKLKPSQPDGVTTESVPSFATWRCTSSEITSGVAASEMTPISSANAPTPTSHARRTAHG